MKRPFTQAMIRIVSPYVLIAVGWFLFSNWLLNTLISDPADRLRWFIYSALAFVLVTGILLAFLVHSQVQVRKRDEEMRHTQSLLLAVTEGTPDAVYMKDTQGKYVFVNASACQIVGKRKEDVLGKDDRALFSPEEARQIMEADRRVIVSGSAQIYEETLTPKGEVRTFLASKAPMRDSQGHIVGISGIIRDITERQRSAQELEKVNRALRVVSDCNQALIYATNEIQFLTELCHIAVERGGYRMAWVGMAESDENKTVRPVAQAGCEEGYLATANISWADNERGRSPMGTAIRTGQMCLVRDVLTDPSFTPWRDEASRRGYASVIALPLADEGKVFGALNIYAGIADAFDAEETSLLIELSTDLAYGIKTLRLCAEHAQAERALSESERKYRELVEHANSIIMRWSCDGRITFLNEFGQRFFGYSGEEILGRFVMDTIVPTTESSGRALNQLTNQICASPKSFEQFTNENIRRNGERVWIAWTNKAVLDEHGRVKEILSIGSDITEKKLAKTALQERTRQLQLALQVAHMGVWQWDFPANHITTIQGGGPISGLPVENYPKNGDAFYALIHPDDRLRVSECVKQAIKGGNLQAEFRIQWPDQRVRWVFAQGQCSYNAEKQPLLLIGVDFDITERKQAEAEVRRLHADLQHYAKELEERVRQRTAQLEASNRELEAFSYSVSHDLRAPLRAIDGWSHILMEESGSRLDTEACDYLGHIFKETRRMGYLIDDLLQLARVSRIEMRRVQVDLTGLVEAIADRMKPAHPDRQIDFLVQPDVQALGDPKLLDVLLTNLLDNACKFTGKCARARIEFGIAKSVGEPTAYFVRDNGAGFDMSRAQRLFGTFQRMHSATEFPGTGIGLATVQRIVQRHGGRIWAAAQVGQGATFFFTLAPDKSPKTDCVPLPGSAAQSMSHTDSAELVMR